MARYFIELSYNGTRFHGWQIQQNATTVQEVLEKALSTLLAVPTEVTGAGRTDTGVHARFYVAHFDYEGTKDPSDKQFIYHLNSMLPHDVAVSKIIPVHAEAHARFSAQRREYQYVISTTKDPFSIETAYRFTLPLDVASMNRAASILLEYDDFTSFAKLHTDNKTNICRLYRAEFHEEGTKLIFTISADRFLRNMVRAIVGSLLDVGKGKYGVEEFRSIIERKDRGAAGGSAAAGGLFLTDIIYPDWVYSE